MSMRDRIAQAIAGIRAYHGSPHNFDKFDVSRVGTGEGFQTYGHGLYFAGNEDVARTYRDKLAPALGKMPDDVIAMPQESRASFMRQVATDRDPMAAAKYAQYGATALRQEDVGKLADLIEQTRRAKLGHMYEVNINAKPEQFVDWDKLPVEQSPHVRRAIDDVMKPVASDYSAHPDLGTRSFQSVFYDMAHPKISGSSANASAALQEAGVPGIRYLDQGSRGVGEGTSNYVVFNPGIVDIMRKYGVAGAAPVGMGALAAQDQYGGAQ